MGGRRWKQRLNFTSLKLGDSGTVVRLGGSRSCWVGVLVAEELRVV